MRLDIVWSSLAQVKGSISGNLPVTVTKKTKVKEKQAVDLFFFAALSEWRCFFKRTVMRHFNPISLNPARIDDFRFSDKRHIDKTDVIF